MARRFVALDRDGTIIAEHHYLADPRKVELLPGAAGGLRHMRALGLGLVLVTNQSGVGRGLFSETQLVRIHARLLALLDHEGVRLDGIYYCPHTPDDGCICRKPRPGMLWRAAHDLDFNARECFVVGDNVGDIELGQCLRAITLLVRTGYGGQVESAGTAAPDYTVSNLREAAQVIERVLRRGASAQPGETRR